MSFSQDDIAKLAHLSRLAVQPNVADASKDTQQQPFAKSIADDLNNILNMIEEISNIDTKNVQPMSHSYPMNQRLRKDEVTELNVVDKMQAIAPENGSKENLYLVPLVVE